MRPKSKTPKLESFDCGDAPAVAVTRGGIAESEHFVCCAACERTGRVVIAAGDIERPHFMRSAAKPLISAVVVASGAYDRFGLDDVELAVATGSHSGELYHLDAVRNILRKIGLDESALQCGPHLPIHGPSAALLMRSGLEPTAVHNNCSGKHAGILALAMLRRADPKTYLSPDNPAQAEILEGCAELLEVPRSSMVIGTDGCGIPAIAVPLRAAAAFFAKLSEPDRFAAGWRTAIARVRDAMIRHPEYVGGTDRFDTTLMRVAKPDIACKGGAEAYHATAALASGIGLCVKIADGNPRAIPPFVIAKLQQLGVAAAQSAMLDKYRVVAVTNHAGTLVGEILPL